MRSILQYIRALFFGWEPVIGGVYQADDGWEPDPFDANSKPFRVEVLDVRHGFVQFRMPSGHVTSSSVRGFASYFFKVKP